MTNSKEKIEIVDVGPRDGLQNEKCIWSVAERVEFCMRLAAAGLKNIEVGAFVSPKWVPQMVGSDLVLSELVKLRKSRILHQDVRLSVLVPNLRGAKDAMAHHPDELSFFIAATEGFSKKNTNCTVDEGVQRTREAVAQFPKVPRRIYVSTCFYCPYDGKTPPTQVVKVMEKLLTIGFREFSIGDTIGAATPRDVKVLLQDLSSIMSLKNIAMHFHDTRGTALLNIYESLEKGIRVFDSSLGGLGGCPYAPGAAGNVGTEDVVYLMESEGFSTGVDLQKLFEVNQWVAATMSKPLPSKLSIARLPKGYSV
ncbi:MAG: hydroxymethylglutaryl-CoA lyase [Bdellovibrionales bacterium]|nr:hydroxymethylglutaryl-CoA lyase [Bdellovibrionales bacterium]